MRSEVHTHDALAWHNDAHMRERTLLRVSIQNVAKCPVRLELLAFDPVEGWDSSQIDLTSDVLMPKDTRTYVIVLTPHDALSPHVFRDALLQAEPSRLAVCTRVLGHVRVAWRIPNAEPGRLRIGPISRTVRVPGAVQGLYTELHMQIDGEWRVDTPCSVTLRLHIYALDPAMHGSTARFLLTLDNAWEDVLVVGMQQHSFSTTLGEHMVVDTTYNLVPLRQGLVSTGGAILRRMDTQQTIRAWRRIAQLHTCTDSK